MQGPILLPIFLIFSLHLPTTLGQGVYYVTSTNGTVCPGTPCLTLNQYKENSIQHLGADMEITLYFLSGMHTLSGMLHIANLSSIVLHGGMDSSNQIVIRCSPSGSFELENISYVHITNLRIHACGIATDHVQSPAISLVAVPNAKVTNCTFSSNKKAGAVSVISSNVTFMSNNVFHNNQAYNGGAISSVCSQLTFLNGTTEFYSNTARSQGGALKLSSCTVTFTGHSLFDGNRAVRGGAVDMFNNTTLELSGYSRFVGNYATSSGGVVYIVSGTIVADGLITFENNTASYTGGVLAAYSDTVTTISFGGNTTFHNNHCLAHFIYYCGGAIFSNNVTLKFSETTMFSGNSARVYGGAIHMIRTNATFYGVTTFTENLVFNHSGYQGDGGGMYVDYDSRLIFFGETMFFGNQAGRGGGIAVSGSGSKIFVGNKSLFLDNTARYGGGLFFYRWKREWQLYLRRGIVVSFVSNTAEKGGAISVVDDNIEKCDYDSESPEPCFFQLREVKKPRTWIKFINNTATVAGTVLYGGLLIRCLYTDYTGSFYIGLYLFKKISHIETNDPLTPAITSDPILVIFCKHVSQKKMYLYVRRGQTFSVLVAAKGEEGIIVPTTIRARFHTKTGKSAQLGEGEAIQAGGSACTELHYSVRSPKSSEELIIYPEGPCRDISGALSVSITFLPCPDGFNLSYSECICEESLQRFTNTCNVNDVTILRKGDFWINLEYDNGTYKGLTLHPHCPFDYCKSEPTDIILNDTDTQCALNRSGILCGECQPGLSLALGSSQCLTCSNMFLLLIIPFALAGIVLVCVLLVLKLTVSVGTINGLIFYANIVAVNKSIFFPPDDHSVLSVFIAWLNLDQGFEICFANGLDAYGKLWLQFVFPIYIWTLVGIMIAGSYYSTRLGRLLGRNPVAVLSTLFLLSYAKLLRTIIAILSFTFLEYPDGTKAIVWIYNGNILLSDSRYTPLLLTAIFTLVFLFLPYTLVLLLSQWLQAKSEIRIFGWINNPKVKPFLDAYHAPYKDKYRYWTGKLLLLRCGLFLVFAFNTLGDPSVNLLAISTVVVGLIPFVRFTGLIYKSPYLDALDASFLLNLGLLAAATHHMRLAGGSQAAVVYTSVSVALVTFVGIVCYHAYLQLKDREITNRVLKVKIQRMLNVFHAKQEAEVVADGVHAENRGDARAEVAQVPVTYIELREPLLTNS